eukprot:2568927-Pyramimonas_sp.AAC.1
MSRSKTSPFPPSVVQALGTAWSSHQQDKKAQEPASKQLQKHEQDIKQREGRLKKLQDEHQDILERIEDLQEKCDAIEAQIYNAEFDLEEARKAAHM